AEVGRERRSLARLQRLPFLVRQVEVVLTVAEQNQPLALGLSLIEAKDSLHDAVADVGRGVARRGRADVFQDVEQYRVIERRRTDWLRPVGERDQADGIRPVFGRAAVEVRPVRPVPASDEELER